MADQTTAATEAATTDADPTNVRQLRNTLADCVVKATEYGEQDGGFVATYLLPTGPIHRAMTLLQEHHGITVRPGYDGRDTASLGSMPPHAQVTPERVAQLFHETYERLAPEYGYRTREASAKPWAEVPEQNRALMVATCAEVLATLGTAGPARAQGGVLAEIAAERARQDAKWGPQNHPDGTGDYPEQIDADTAKMACQNAAEGGYLDWLHILREEVAEAFAATGPELRTELVQVAAVAVAWVEAIDRRMADQTPQQT
ncbi:hypothetical protein [Polymorphospora lycopeni]|uniref:Uncharacterized protein n=1 Tax=Polymorphospora lycopeni TaxID=3140240 RepID=A0ABV5CKR3_9ACTN